VYLNLSPQNYFTPCTAKTLRVRLYSTVHSVGQCKLF